MTQLIVISFHVKTIFLSILCHMDTSKQRAAEVADNLSGNVVNVVRTTKKLDMYRHNNTFGSLLVKH